MKTSCLWFFLFLTIHLLLLAQASFAEETIPVSSAGGVRPDGQFIAQDLVDRTLSLKEDMVYLWQSSTRPSQAGLIKAISTGAITTFLMALDEDIRHEVKENDSHTLDTMESVFEPMGRWEIQGLAGGALLGLGYLNKDKKLIESSLTGLEAYAVSGGLVEIIKLAAGRERPYEEKGAGAFLKGGVSFPSGHATRSFAWAAVFSEYYHASKIIPLASYSLATLASLSRLESDAHWASDIFVGACLGFGIGKGLSHVHLKPKDNRFSLSPLISEEAIGLSAGVKF